MAAFAMVLLCTTRMWADQATADAQAAITAASKAIDVMTGTGGSLPTAIAAGGKVLPGAAVAMAQGISDILGTEQGAAGMAAATIAASDATNVLLGAASGLAMLQAASGGGTQARLAVGSFSLAVEDLSYRSDGLKVEFARNYESRRTAGHSLGTGWVFSYDTRVLRGTDRDAAATLEYLTGRADAIAKEQADKAKARQVMLDRIDTAKVAVLAAENDASAALTLADEAVRLAYLTGDLTLHASADKVETDAQGIKSEIDGPDGMLTNLAAARVKLVSSQDDLDGLTPVINDVASKSDAYGKVAMLAAANHALNRLVANSGDPEYEQYTGNGTAVLVDEAGSPHMYRMTEQASIDSVIRLPDNSINYYPLGSAMQAAEPTDDSLELKPDGSYVRTKKDGTKYLYSYLGQLVRIVDTNGNGLAFGYSSASELVSITDDYNRETNIERQNGLIALITDPASRTVAYGYDGDGYLASVRDTGRATVAYRYTDKRLTNIVNPDGSSRTSVYEDKDGRTVLTSVADEEGKSEKYRYFDGYTEAENAAGIVEKHYFDDRFREKKIEYADGGATEFAYDGKDNLTDLWEEWDGQSHHTSFTYDDARNRLSATYPDEKVHESWTYTTLNKVATHVEKNGETTAYTYDDEGNQLSIDYPGPDEKFSYDERGRLTRRVDRNGSSTTFGYDRNGYVSIVRHPVTAVDGTTTDVIERYTNDAIGEVLVYTDGEGTTTTSEYNGDGKVTRAIDMHGKTESFEYDNRKDLVKRTDKLGNATRYYYDKRHLLLRVINPLGEVVAYEYRDDGKPTAKVLGKIEESSQPATSSNTADAVGSGAMTLAEAAAVSVGQIDGAGRSQRLGALASATGVAAKPAAVSDGVIDGHPLVTWESRTVFDYDGRGNLKSRLQVETSISELFTYYENGLPKRSVDGAGNPTDYGYDVMGRLKWNQDAREQRSWFSYWPSGKTRTVKDRNGNTTSFNYDANDRLVEKIDPLLKSDQYDYDGNGNLVWHRDRNTAETTMEYDEFNRPKLVTGPNFPADTVKAQERFFYNGRGQLVKRVDKNGQPTTYTYDDLGRLLTTIDALGKTMTYGYDDAGNLTNRTDRRANTWQYQYDALGRVQTADDPYEKATSYEYSIFGSLGSKTNALDETWQNEYDAAGRLIATIDPLLARTEYTYDGNGKPLTVKDPVGRVTTYTYDELGRLSTEARGSQAQIAYGYDNERNLTTITDPTGAVYQYFYNELDLPKTETNRLNVSQSYTYYDDGRLKTKTDFGATPISYKYDAQGNRTEVDHDDGTKSLFSYDAMGNLTKASNAAQAYEFDYDPLGRLSAAKNLDLGEQITYSYDEEGNQTDLAWHGGKRTITKSYGKAGELLSVVDSEGGMTDFSYDDVLREINRKLPNGLVQVKGYDPAGRLTVAKTMGGPFDEAGKLSNEAYVYDASGKRTYTVDEKGRITAYRYDDAGRLVEVLYPFKSGKVAADFDERLTMGLFPQFENGVPTQTGNPKLHLGFSVPDVPGFDEAGFESELQGSLDDEDAIAKAYLGISAQPGGEWKVTPGDGATPFAKQLQPSGTEPAMIRAAAVRANGRNTSIDTQPYLWDETYSYDSRNNREAKANGWGRIDYAYDAENRLTGAGKRSYTNDANGNLVEEVLGSIKAEYAYDFENRAVDVYSQMTGFVGKGKGSVWTLQAGVRYEYDALGRRVSRTEYDTITRGQKRQREWNAGTAMDYLYDGTSMNVLAEAREENFAGEDLPLPYQPWNGDRERDGHGKSKGWPGSRSDHFYESGTFHPESEYVYGKGGILERIDFDTAHYRSAVKGDAQYYALDILGSVMMTTDKDGGLRDRYEYDAYGQAFEGSFRRINDLGYNGKRTDPTTGLVDYGFRDYAPRLGRFTTADPVKDGLNWYAYVNNDPMNATDPTGLNTSGDGSDPIKNGDVVYEHDHTVEYHGNREYDGNDAGVGSLPTLTGSATPQSQGLVLNAATQTSVSLFGLTLGIGTNAGVNIGSNGGAAGLGLQIGLGNSSQGFMTFNQLKAFLGPAGFSMEWHHIVEQAQIKDSRSGFAPEVIQNPGNIISLVAETHTRISAYYSSKQPFTDGQTVRDYLAGKPFEYQFGFGIDILRQFGGIP
ncbi:MAG TPA: RHS repeat-associated core domain-containing protein [Rectinemataceae bacterium]|nr:RHS repeat-associated core domain-containing protein [Rectinemataceae bacterium]